MKSRKEEELYNFYKRNIFEILFAILKGMGSLESLGVDERIILKGVLNNYMRWTYLAEDRQHWPALVAR
jgi:hypothetical protein